MSAWRRFPGVGLLVVMLFVSASVADVSADVIRLSNGSLVEGQIIRDDDTAVVILVRGRPEFYAADDVSAVIYSQLRVAPKGRGTSATGLGASNPLADISLVAKIRERLLTYHGFMVRVGIVSEHLRWQEFRRAGVAAQKAAQWILPLDRGQFSPSSTLADLLILLGLRAPTLWLALLLFGERRAFTRIVEFLVPAYGLLMLLMVYVPVTGVLWFQIALFPAAVVAIAWLFMWMFALTPGRTLLAYSLCVALNVALEALLVYQGWLTASAASQAAARLALMH